MSIFWLGGPERIVADRELRPEMFEDRFFLPGLIHGDEDTLIRVYLNDVWNEGDPDQFVVELLSRTLILEAHKLDPSHGQIFSEKLVEEAENFACLNDGTGDFATLVEVWPKAVVMSNQDMVDWANDVSRPKAKEPVVDRNDLPDMLGQIIEVFEDFLEEKGIDVPNDEKAEADDPESAAIIYGTDYGWLQTELEKLLVNWNIIEEETP